MKIFQAKIANDATPVRSPEPLKIGDVVKLKSGGPLMTVCWVHGEAVHCMWLQTGLSDTYTTETGFFQPACLDVYEPDNKGD